MELKKKIIELFNTMIKFFKKKKLYFYLLSGIPFISLDLFTRLLTPKASFFNFISPVPLLFTIIWVYFILGIAFCVKNNGGKAIYRIFFIVSLIIYYVNNIYYSMSGSFFDFHLLGLASEGSEYFIDAIVNANIWIYILSIIPIVLFIILSKIAPFQKVTRRNLMIFGLVLFSFLHTIIPIFLGEANNELTWNTWKNPRNIYENFNDNNKSASISGLYEYTFRNFYVTYIKKKKTNNEKELEFLNNIFETVEISKKNKYTGKFKGKNIIFLQLEGIDNWVLKKDIMPNTYSLLNNSINFNNHYSFYNGGGSTFNSEFAVNTGYLTPITYNQNAYTFNKNDFPYTMPKIFKKIDYNVNAFHMNSGEYYSRKINYESWGYDNYYGLKDLVEYKNDDYKMDTELINNKLFYEKQFLQDGKFINYLITYTLHMPFSQGKGMCKLLLEKNKIELDPLKPLTEEDCVKVQAKETDDMVGLLIKALKDNNLYDKTIIVGFTDHYLYTLSDQTILEKYKDTKTNLINKTPFFIWSKGMKKVNINKVTSQLNIFPTILNLMGINYNPNYYSGTDALANNYVPITFFNDLSWYDGNYYVFDGKIIKGNKKHTEKIEERNSYVNYLIKKNDLMLKHNFFKEIKKVEVDSLK